MTSSEAATAETQGSEPGNDRRGRLTRFYVLLALFGLAGIAASLAIGAGRDAERSFSGRYELRPPSDCVGRTFDLRQSGQFAQLTSPDGDVGGALRVDDGAIRGRVECLGPGTVGVDLRGSAASIEGRIGQRRVLASRSADVPPPESQRSVRPATLSGFYDLAPLSSCLGSEIELDPGDGDRVELDGSGQARGTLSYHDGLLRGATTCENGSRVRLEGDAADRTIQMELESAGGGRAAPERIEAVERTELADTVGEFLLALVVVVVVARSFGALAVRIRQPRVMGEVVAGIVLGPTVLGALAPSVASGLFPSDLTVTLGVVANLGVLLYMFMIGVEVDIAQLRQRLSLAVTVSSASLILPMVLGMAVAVPTYELVGPDVGFTGFALFMGVAMSITAFPVLARILAERGMLSAPIGVTAMTAAAIGDVIAWFLIALATAFATAGEGADVLVTIALALVFCGLMLAVVRPLLARAFARLEDQSRLSPGWLAGVLGAVLLAAYVTEAIGIAVIFGAFLMGLVMPRGTKLTEDASRRIQDFVVLLLLPLFFAYTGLRTNVSLLNDPALWLLAGGLLLVAIVGKFGGALIGARASGVGWRSSAILGTLMNTRGLTELIALNLALDLGVISEALFTALVLMALITTFMAGPLLNLLDRRRPAPRAEPAAAVESGASA